MLRSRQEWLSGSFIRLSRGSRPLIPLGSRIRPFSNVRQSPTAVAPSRRWTCQLEVSHRAYSSQTSGIKRTPLYDLHVEHGGKLVPFGGYELPVEYRDQSIKDSSIWTRQKASLFDVSHMTIHKFSGTAAGTFLEYITPSDLTGLKPDHSTYTAMLNDNAGIVDDMIVTKLNYTGQDEFCVVTNAGTRQRVCEYIAQELNGFKSKHQLPDDAIVWDVQQSCSLLAVQGPLAAEILQSMSPTSGLTSTEPLDLSTLSFGQAQRLHFHSLPEPHTEVSGLAWRTGYTGEDGFELLVEPSSASSASAPGAALARAVLAAGSPSRIRLAGLGARDALRLEAGLCLHGADMSEAVTPLEASLAWIVPRARRRGDAGFKGAAVMYGPGAVPARTKRVGLALRGGAAARQGAKVVLVADGREVGVVTSGAPSPALGRPIAMASVERGVKVGDEVAVQVRGKERMGEVIKMPFVPTKYYKAPESGKKA